MKSALLERNNVKINAKDYVFELNGAKILFAGYLKIFQDNDIEKKIIPSLKVGESLSLIKLNPKQSFTKAPARYNEASLVKILEKEGIGRPSTYAVIIDKIQTRNYVEKENKRFLPTKLGIVVDEFLMKYFSNIINVKFTANMESKLDKIESGEDNWQKILDIFYQPLLHDIDKLKQKPPRNLIEQSKMLTDEKCSICGSPMEIKNGPYGKYLACSKNPLEHPTKPYMIKIGIPCPMKDCNGEIIKRKSKKGRIFYGCSNYPKCNFYSIHMPVNERCPKCGSILVKITSKQKGTFYQCSSKKCDYRKKVSKNE
jgi:DNA topoisomerase-1